MNKLNNIITTYQQKICKHDRQLWEQSYEKELFQRLQNVPRKVAKINTSLIDVDLFRGSTFSVSKSQSGWLSVAVVAWFRLVFYPFFYQWWLYSTCGCVFALLSVLYVFQLGSFVVWYRFSDSTYSETMTMADYITPYIMMYVLTVVHCHITINYSIPLRHSSLTANGIRTKMSHVQQTQSPSNEKASYFDRSAVCDDAKLVRDEHLRSHSSPCCNTWNRKRESHFDVYKSGKHWIGMKFGKWTPETGRKGTSKNGGYPRKRESDLKLSEAVSSSTQLITHIGCKRNQEKSSRESLSAGSSIAASSTLTVVDLPLDRTSANHQDENSSVRTETMHQVITDRKCAYSNEIPLGEDVLIDKTFSKTAFDLSRDIEAVEEVMKSNRGMTTLSDVQHSCYVLSSLESQFDERTLEAMSLADSNTSMSDTCNSSFVSSGEDDQQQDTKRSSSGSRYQFDSESGGMNMASSGIRSRRKVMTRHQRVPPAVLISGKRGPFQASSLLYPDNPDMLAHVSKLNRLTSDLSEVTASSDEEELFKKVEIKLRGQAGLQPTCHRSGICRHRKTGSDKCLDENLSATAANSQNFNRKGIRTSDSEYAGSAAFPTSVMPSKVEEVKIKKRLLAGRASSRQGNLDGTHQTMKNNVGNPTESSTAGCGTSSLINSMSSNADKVSCIIWSAGGIVHKVDMTILDIGWTIIQAVDRQQERCDYMMLGVLLSFVVMCMPSIYRVYHNLDRESQVVNCTYANVTQAHVPSLASLVFGHDFGQTVILVNGLIQRLCLSLMFFFLLSVAERTFKQRLLYAKYFCYLTSSRKAKKYDLPHFRLNKVRNIKTWLSLRSFLKKRGPQRSVESVVSTAFLLAVVLVSILCIELLQDYGHFLEDLGNWELVLWSMILGIYLLRFITLGTKINKKYRNLSVLITEQINLYLHMEQKPHKKEALMVANSVLKLAEDLLKELESPFKISGLSANPFLYNITKVVILSAFSAVLTELLGFKLKLYKIKIRS